MVKVHALIVCLAVIAGAATTQEAPETIICHVKVVDAQAKPVVGAEVAACQVVRAYPGGEHVTRACICCGGS